MFTDDVYNKFSSQINSASLFGYMPLVGNSFNYSCFSRWKVGNKLSLVYMLSTHSSWYIFNASTYYSCFMQQWIFRLWTGYFLLYLNVSMLCYRLCVWYACIPSFMICTEGKGTADFYRNLVSTTYTCIYVTNMEYIIALLH